MITDASWCFHMGMADASFSSHHRGEKNANSDWKRSGINKEQKAYEILESNIYDIAHNNYNNDKYESNSLTYTSMVTWCQSSTSVNDNHCFHKLVKKTSSNSDYKLFHHDNNVKIVDNDGHNKRLMERRQELYQTLTAACHSRHLQVGILHMNRKNCTIAIPTPWPPQSQYTQKQHIFWESKH